MSNETKNKDYGRSRGQTFDENNSLNVKGQDVSGRQSLNTVFGDKIIANRKPSLSAQFQYGLATDQATITVTGSGAITTSESMLKASTGAASSSSAIVQSNEFLRYIPGHEGYALFTVVFATPKAGSQQRAGLYDGTDGFSVGYTDTTFEFVVHRDGVETQSIIDLKTVFDDGSFDPTKGNIYRISFAYLGFGTIHLEIMTPEGGWVDAAHIEYPNSAIVTHIMQTFLPMRAEVINTTNATNLEIRSGSLSAGIADGGIIPGTATDPNARPFSMRATQKTASSGVLIAFRNKTTYKGIENRVNALLKLVSAVTDGTKSVGFRVLMNPAFTGTPTWNDVDTDDSVLEFSEDFTLDTGAEDGPTFFNFDMAKVDTFFETLEGQNLQMPPGGTGVFYFESANSTVVDLSIRWAELF